MKRITQLTIFTCPCKVKQA